MPSPPDTPALRRAALAVSVLDDLDLEPYDTGVLLAGATPVRIDWVEVRRALAGAEPGTDVAHRRLRRHLQTRRLVANLPYEELATRARPIGYPVADPLHPGVDWVRERVLGGVLDLGLGLVGIGPDPDAVMVVPQSCFDTTREDARSWPGARQYLERMGAIAVERLRSDTTSTLRPIGDCDVVTLLASRTLRGYLCAGNAGGLRPAAVPMRRRGWLDLTRIDPAFALAAAAAVDVEDRGFPRPLLLTIDEVVLAPTGGRPAEIVLRDPAVAAAGLRDVRWR